MDIKEIRNKRIIMRRNIIIVTLSAAFAACPISHHASKGWPSLRKKKEKKYNKLAKFKKEKRKEI